MMGKAFVSGGAVMTAPVTGVPLSEVAVGSVVKLNESGSPVEFYVAKHNYESGLNGAGRTLLLRKVPDTEMAWHSSTVNAYATSAIDAWFNSDYKSRLDADIQEAIGTTKFYYVPGNGTTTVSTISRAVFTPSILEFGNDSTFWGDPDGGSALGMSREALCYDESGKFVYSWTRTPVTYNQGKTAAYSSADQPVTVTKTNYGPRPCFTLPATALVQTDGTIKI